MIRDMPKTQNTVTDNKKAHVLADVIETYQRHRGKRQTDRHSCRYSQLSSFSCSLSSCLLPPHPTTRDRPITIFIWADSWPALVYGGGHLKRELMHTVVNNGKSPMFILTIMARDGRFATWELHILPGVEARSLVYLWPRGSVCGG